MVQQEQDAFFLLDTEGGEVFRVNETAVRIFELCRGGSTLDDAVRTLAMGLRGHGLWDEIRQDVCRTVAQFQELGLCEVPAASDAPLQD
jgi:hypothetical protein